MQALRRVWSSNTRRSKQTIIVVIVFFAAVLVTYYLELELPAHWKQQIAAKAQSGNVIGSRVTIIDAETGDTVAEFINAKEDEEAKKQSDAYFEQKSPDGGEGKETELRGEDDGGEEASNNNGDSEVKSENDWPTRYDGYSPLSKGSIARTVFNDHGETLLPATENYESSGPRKLSREERSSGVHIVTTFFHGSYEDRRFSEIVAALIANLENPHVAFVHALWEKEDPTQYVEKNGPELLRKLVATEVKNQPSYSRMFKYVNNNLLRGSIAIVTNADIYFDSGLKCLKGPDPNSNATLLKNNERSVYALSRRHTQLCGKAKADHGSVLDLCQDYIHSHDAFVFAPPVPNKIIAKTNHMQNRYGGENIVIWEFTLLGYKVMNPCKKVHAIHLHCSAERHYVTRFIDGFQGNGPYRHGTVWPGTVRIDTSRRGWKGAGNLPCGQELL